MTICNHSRWRRRTWAGILGAALLAQAGWAQVIQTLPPGSAGPPPVNAPLEKIERTPEAAGVAGSPGASERAMKPGTLLITGFDLDRDGEVSTAELKNGAEYSFRLADANSSASLDGFEQSDWAKRVGGGDGVLANVMLFDANLDQQVTNAEFIEGVMRLAEPMRAAEDGSISLAGLRVKAEARQPQTRPPFPIAGP